VIGKDNEVKKMYVKYLRQRDDEIQEQTSKTSVPTIRCPLKIYFLLPIINQKLKLLKKNKLSIVPIVLL